jgi:hypothetical protein
VSNFSSLLKVAVNTITIYLQTLLYRPPAKPRSPKRRPPPRRVPREDPVGAIFHLYHSGAK